MFDETSRLNIVAMGDDEFFVLSRCYNIFAEFFCAQGTIHQRHGHRLAFGLAEDKTIAARKLWRNLGRSFELVDHLTFSDLDPAK